MKKEKKQSPKQGDKKGKKSGAKNVKPADADTDASVLREQSISKPID